MPPLFRKYNSGFSMKFGLVKVFFICNDAIVSRSQLCIPLPIAIVGVLLVTISFAMGISSGFHV